ncbi:CRAL-TRIO domain-containing protein [Hyaloraphidium curvatum]|nr:CRAL-TRIO domain-containing protein [Hyaloraphidium curvatum]
MPPNASPPADGPDSPPNPSDPPPESGLVPLVAWRDERVLPLVALPGANAFLSDATLRRCPDCDAEEKAHCFLPVGWDSSGRVVVYGSPPRATRSSVPETVDHVVRCLELCFSHPFTTSGQWTWLVDFAGFGLRHAMQARLGITFASTFEAHFPERLGRLVLVNPPGVFDLLLAAIRPFADQRTLDKVVSVHGAPTDAAFVARVCEAGGFDDEGLRGWVGEVLKTPSGPVGLPVLGDPARGGGQWRAVREVQMVPASWVCKDEG